MKKIFLITASIFSLHLYSNAKGGAGGLLPGGEDCKGGGSCGITHTSTGVASTFYFNESNSSLLISFTYAALMKGNPEMAEQIEGKSTFIFANNVQATPELSRILGADATIIIPKGNYPLKEEDGVYTITINRVQFSNE